MHARYNRISFIGLGSHTAAPLLYSYIQEHPECATPGVVTHFFSDSKRFAAGVSWYEAQFVTTKTRTICGELAHDYLVNSQAAGLIARTYPDAKLLGVIENPLVSVRVEYVEAVREGRVRRKTSLAEFLTQNPEVLMRAKYGRQLAQYFAYYAPGDLLIYTASDIRADVLGTVKQTYAHLGLSDTFVPLTLRHLVVEEIDEKNRPGFIKRRIMAVRKLVRGIYGLVTKFVKPKEIKTETASELARRLPLTPELEAKLKDYFRKDVSELSALLHRNLTVEWGFGDDL
jgi:hypothetical protein